MSNKNPYEIRLELLNLVFGILNEQKNTKQQYISERLRVYGNNTSWGFTDEKAGKHYYNQDYINKLLNDLSEVKSPTTDEILTEVEKLNSFVSKDTKHKDEKHEREHYVVRERNIKKRRRDSDEYHYRDDEE